MQHLLPAAPPQPRTIVDPAPLAYSVEMVAKRLNISETSVRQAIKSGELYAIRVGRRLLIPALALEKLLSGEK